MPEARRAGDYEIAGALTTVTDTFGRVSMHGVREILLAAQLAAARLPSIVVRIPFPCTNVVYESEMSKAMAQAQANGITQVIFGDLFLEDIRAYRAAKLSAIGMEAVFPLWQRPTHLLAREMIESGLSAHLATVDLAKLSPEFCGRRFDETLLSDLPREVDPCGENGEFHSFVTRGPMFERAIAVTVGETVIRDGFAYTDLLPA
ncbi:MAG: ATP-binding protein [Pseudorhodoplanes sp.]